MHLNDLLCNYMIYFAFKWFIMQLKWCIMQFSVKTYWYRLIFSTGTNVFAKKRWVTWNRTRAAAHRYLWLSIELCCDFNFECGKISKLHYSEEPKAPFFFTSTGALGPFHFPPHWCLWHRVNSPPGAYGFPSVPGGLPTGALGHLRHRVEFSPGTKGLYGIKGCALFSLLSHFFLCNSPCQMGLAKFGVTIAATVAARI